MSRYIRCAGLAKACHESFFQNLPAQALLQLKKFLSQGGFIAGGFARAMYLSAMHSMTKSELSDQFSDIDFYFRQHKSKADLNLDDEPEWLDCSEHYANAGAFKRVYVEHSNNFLTSSSTASTLNAITFKSGEIEDVLDTFDLDNCKIAVDGNDIVMISDFDELERSSTIRLNQEEIVLRAKESGKGMSDKQCARIAKYYSRLRKLHSRAPTLSQRDLDFIKSMLLSTKHRLALSSETSKMLVEQYSTSELMELAMLLWPNNFLKTNLMYHVFKQ